MEVKNKRIMMLLSVILILGLLANAGVLFAVNQWADPLEHLGALHEEDLFKRLEWIRKGEYILAICESIYFCGHIIWLYHLVKKKRIFTIKSIFLYFGLQICLIYISVIPFLILDRNWIATYMYPTYNLIILILILVLISLVASVRGARKYGESG